MNFRVLLTSVALLTASALILYGFAGYLNPLLGVPEGDTSLLNSFWSLEAIAIGTSILIGYAHPHVRGVKRGDRLVAVATRSPESVPAALNYIAATTVTALENGRVGGKIKVQLDAEHRGEALILSYAGTFSPPLVQIVEREW